MSSLWSAACAFVLCAASSVNGQELSNPDLFPFTGISINAPGAQIERQDVFWLADKIVISSPLRSYGGDIVLFANEIEIDAPIDSRVYFDHTKEFRRFYAANLGPNGKALPNGIRIWFDKPSDMHSMFDNYYTSGLEMQGNSRITGILPQLPDGLVQFNFMKLAANIRDIQPADGSLPLYDIVQLEHERSGNIYIFAHQIKVGSTSLAIRNIDDEDDCVPSPKLGDPKLIVSAGARGGKGGLGTPAACFMSVPDPPKAPGLEGALMQVSYPYICNRPESQDDRRKEGGLSFFGGRGADAGNTTIYIVNNARDLTQISASLRPFVDISGGITGLRTISRTPSLEGTNRVTRSRCSLIKTRVSEVIGEGKPATFSTQNVDANQAVDTLLFLAAALSSRPSRDINAIAQKTYAQDSAQAITPFDSLYRFLSDSVKGNDFEVLNDLRQELKGARQSSVEPYGAVSLRGLQSNSLMDALADNQNRIALRNLSDFVLPWNSTDRLFSYFVKTDGVLKTVESNPASRLDFETIKADLSRSNSLLANIRVDLSELKSLTFQQLAYTQEKDLRAAIDQAKSALDEARNEVGAKQQTLPYLVKLVPLIASAYTNTASFGESLYKYFDAPASAEADPRIKAADDLSEKMSKATSSVSALVQYLTPEKTKTIEPLEDQLRNAVDAYAALLTKVREIEDQILATKTQELVEALKLRASAEARIADSRTDIFSDLLKGSVATFAADPSHNPQSLQNNIDRIELLLKEYPSRVPYFDIKVADYKCSGMNERAGCLDVSSSSKTQVVVAPLFNWSSALPLYVVAPSSLGYKLRVYDLKARVKPYCDSTVLLVSPLPAGIESFALEKYLNWSGCIPH